MKKLFLLIRRYPLEIILGLAFAALFLRYPEMASANLFLLISILVARYISLSKNFLVKIISPILLIGSLCVYYFLSNEGYAFLFISLSLVIALLTAFLSMSFSATAKQDNSILRLLILGLVVILLMPVTYGLGNRIILKREKAAMDKYVAETEERLMAELNSLSERSKVLAEDQFLPDLIAGSKYDDLNGYLQNLMLSQGLTYLTVTDCNSLVLARAHQSKLIGDDYSLIAPTSGSPESFAGLFYEHDRIFLASANKIVSKEQVCLGYLSSGSIVDNAFAGGTGSTGFIFDDGLSGVIGSNDTAKEALNSIAGNLSTTVGGELLINLEGKRVLVSSYFSDKLGAKILSAQHIEDYSTIVIANLVFYLLIVIVAYHFAIGFGKGSNFLGIELNEKTKIFFKISLELIAIIAIVSAFSVRNSEEFVDWGEPVQGSSGAETILRPKLSLISKSLVTDSEPITVSLRLSNLPEGSSSVKTAIKFSEEYLAAETITSDEGHCDQIYDQNIDNKAGTVTFSCVLKYSGLKTSDSVLAEMVFFPKKTGVASIFIQKNETSIRSSSGDSDCIESTFPDGEKILIGK